MVYHTDPNMYSLHSVEGEPFTDIVHDKKDGEVTRVGEKYEPWQTTSPEYRGGHMVYRIDPKYTGNTAAPPAAPATGGEAAAAAPAAAPAAPAAALG